MEEENQADYKNPASHNLSKILNALLANYITEVTKYGQCPNTDTLDISETINPTKKYLMNKIFIII